METNFPLSLLSALIEVRFSSVGSPSGSITLAFNALSSAHSMSLLVWTLLRGRSYGFVSPQAEAL